MGGKNSAFENISYLIVNSEVTNEVSCEMSTYLINLFKYESRSLLVTMALGLFHLFRIREYSEMY